ncbi:hypothetical protein MTO96_023343 [Rhipicephalus appendiculatus]
MGCSIGLLPAVFRFAFDIEILEHASATGKKVGGMFKNIDDFIPPSQDADNLLSYLENILAASELKPRTCEVFHNVWTFPSERHLAGAISAVPVADGVPEHEMQELAKAMSAEMLRRSRKGPAGFSADFDAYVVHASRSAASRSPQ